jgi:hypothetical protein
MKVKGATTGPDRVPHPGHQLRPQVHPEGVHHRPGARQRNQQTGRSLLMNFVDHGIVAIPGNNDRGAASTASATSSSPPTRNGRAARAPPPRPRGQRPAHGRVPRVPLEARPNAERSGRRSRSRSTTTSSTRCATSSCSARSPAETRRRTRSGCPDRSSRGSIGSRACATAAPTIIL